MSQLTETIIQQYSLLEATEGRSDMFDILAYNGENTYDYHPEIFLNPHRKDYYMVVFVEHGDSKHWIDMVPYTLQPNTMYFTTPPQVQLKEEAKPSTGKMICFTEEFLAVDENKLLRDLPIIQNPNNEHKIELTNEDIVFIKDVTDKMFNEFKQRNDWKNGMLLAYLRVLLIYLSRLYMEQFKNEYFPEDRALLKKFRDLIEDNYKGAHEVSAFAGMLYITPGYLNEVIKQQSGKTAIAHIHERLMLEAKRLLFHTENSIKEIAFLLGFEDASYFNRFFKRLSSQTPALFRSTTREMYH